MIDATQDDAAPRRDPARVEAEKRRRALLLAQRVEQAGTAADGRRYLFVRLGGARYGLPLESVDELHALPPVTPLPGAPPFIAGVVCLGGEPLTLVDLGRLLGAAPVAAGAAEGAARLVVVAFAGERVGLRVDAVEEVQRARVVHALPRAGSTSWLTEEQVQGVTGEAVVLLDLQRVLADPRVRVEQVSTSGAGGTS